jgi:hypothetical protein
LLAALMLVVALPVGQASASPPRASSVTLSSHTTVAWTGVKAVRLVVPTEVSLPAYGARLTLRGGSYAFVRIAPAKSCDGGVRCLKGQIDYTHDMAPYLASSDGAGADHLTRIGGSNLVRSTYELYLFTDGAATLTFDRTGLRGARTAVTAAGRARGEVHVLPITCAAPGCSPAEGHAKRLWYGGGARDVGSMGSADVLVATYDRAGTPIGDYPNERATRGCAYPRGPGDATPPRSDTGCDMTDRDMPADAFNMVNSFVNYGKASFMQIGNYSGRGRIWLGFQAVQAHDVADPLVQAHGIWFTYGVR